MAGDVLILGDIVFEDFGIPESIRGGMGQMLGEEMAFYANTLILIANYRISFARTVFATHS